MRFSIWKPWRRCKPLRGFSDAQARRLWNDALRESPLTFKSFFSVIMWPVAFVALANWLLMLSEQAGGSVLEFIALLACAVVITSPLLLLNTWGVNKRQEARITQMIADGRAFRSTKNCISCGYSLLGVRRWKVGDRVQATCPECGGLAVIGEQDVRIFEILEAAEAPGDPTPSPPASP